MQKIDLFTYYQSMSGMNVVLAFEGAISQSILVGLAEMIKEKLSVESFQSKISKKIFSIFIELAQNIHHYSIEKVQVAEGKSVGKGIIIVQENENEYLVSSGNLMKSENSKPILDKCNLINSLKPEELKSFYKQQVKIPRAFDNDGGGIGLIDVARKSNSKLDVQIKNVDEESSFFILSVKINKEK